MTFRSATPTDAEALRDLEREANLASLQHVFPPERFPYPADEVLARWIDVLTEPDVVVEVTDAEGGGLACCMARDATTVRHLAVRPDHWGTGLARAALTRAVEGIRSAGSGRARLWCLRENHRARGLYEHLGWSETGAVQQAPWPPHPDELEYSLSLGFGDG